jgi:hypothetical protein
MRRVISDAVHDRYDLSGGNSVNALSKGPITLILVLVAVVRVAIGAHHVPIDRETLREPCAPTDRRDGATVI